MWSIQKIDDNKGFGLFATKDIFAGFQILEEDPIVCSQFSWNKLYRYQACDYCMKSLESAESICKRLLQNNSATLPYSDCCPSHSLQPVTCPNCETEYCSSQCQHNAYQEYHQILCPASRQVSPFALEQLDETWRSLHFPPETSSIMMIVKMIARIKQDGSGGDFRSKIEQFCHSCRNNSGELVHKLLGDEFEEQLKILREQLQLCIYDESVAHWFSPEGFQNLFALLGANQQGIGSSSLSVWVDNCEKLALSPEEKDRLDEFIDNLYEDLDRVSGVFLSCEGAGLYSIQSKCNHSCSPNAEVCFQHNSSRLTLKSLRNINKGEEITISYLSECQLSRSRHSRQKFLRENYIFRCTCDKCLSQRDDPDFTSSEDDDSDEICI